MSAASATGAAVGARRNHARHLARVATTVAAAAALTAGCAAGQIAQTADEKSTIDGINASVGTMDLRAVAIEAPPSQRTTYPAGSSAALKVVFTNNARAADRLVGIRTAAAGGWGAYTSAQDAFNVVLATNGDVPATSPASAATSSSASSAGSSSAGSSPADTTSETPSSASSSPSSAASSSGSTSGSTSGAASLPQGVQTVTIPAAGRVGFGTPEATGALLLTKITRTLRPAQTVSVAFTFANAGTVTVPVTVQVADLGRTKPVGEPGSAEEAGN